MNAHKCYVTTPIYYINAKPHLGTLYSTTIADVIARWNKINGKNVFFLTGTDEHGQKIEEKAHQSGKHPQAFVDSMVPDFKNTWRTFGIEYTSFIRTTDQSHIRAVVTWIKKMQAQGDIYKAHYVGWYCVPCETYVTQQDREAAPQREHFQSDDARSCPTCQRPLQQLAEESYFFRLSAYESQLLEFYEKNPSFILPKERFNEIISFVKSGLKDLSISRKGLTWGIPFPGDPDHTVYVWADALNNYISAVGFGSEDRESSEKFRSWWPADVHVMGKDITRFHAVYWPAFLMAAQLPLPKHLLVHGYILVNDVKMSKSLGNVVDPDTLAKTYGVEPVRYYLMRHLSITQDGHFSFKNLEEHINAELAYGLGNLVQRSLSLAVKNGLTQVKPLDVLEGKTCILREQAEEMVRSYCDEMGHYQFHLALQAVWKYIGQVNAYFHEHQPWQLAKTDKEMFHEVISATCHSLYEIAFLLWPVMPNKMETLLGFLGYHFTQGTNYLQQLRKNSWNKEFILSAPAQALFVRIEPEKDLSLSQASTLSNLTFDKKQREETVSQDIPKENESSFIDISDFAKVDLLVGHIIECLPVTGSDKLYRLTVDLGEQEKRTILSGVAQHFKLEDLIGKQGIFVTNLKPRKMLGIESQGMMLFAKDAQGKMVIATVGGSVLPGTRLG